MISLPSELSTFGAVIGNILLVMLSSDKKFDDLSQTAGIRRTTAGLPNGPASYLPRSVSLMPPTTLRTLPAALSALPSLSSLASPVSLPATSFTLPLVCWAEPFIRSLSMSMFLHSRDLIQLKEPDEVSL